MAPVALFIDGVSLWLAYYAWTLCPTAGGQESSTRYIRLDEEGLVSPDTLGIPESEREAWQRSMAAAFATYREAVAFWESLVKADPNLARIPRTLQEDTSDKAKKAVARMRRNYAFDRARYFLPVAAATNLMLVMSARAWVILIQHLLSHPLPEAKALGAACREELGFSAPRLLKHAQAQPSLVEGLQREFEAVQSLSKTLSLHENREKAPTPCLDVLPPPGGLTGGQAATDLELHGSRYAYFGESLRRTAVRFSWEAVAFAEIRDLNRHRTGTKYCPLLPVGFYFAADELPSAAASAETYGAFGETGFRASEEALRRLGDGIPGYVYYTLLGTQYPFEHTTTADKFLYEAELRTGTGAHYRYARHLHDVLALWYDRYPETRGLVLEGSAEPE
jgi:thymidylate synthase ThyX